MTYNPARNSDLARRDVDADEAALGVVSLYGTIGADGFAPGFAVAIDEQVERYRTHNPTATTSLAIRQVQQRLMEIVTRNPQTRLGSVSLDFDGVEDQRTFAIYDSVNAVGLPQVIFGALSTSSYLYQDRGYEAIAVHYLPPATPRIVVNQVTGATEAWANSYYRQGYLGIARCFATIDDAETALSELVGAVKTIRTKQSAREDEEIDFTEAVAAFDM
jgi:hypothetical protein